MEILIIAMGCYSIVTVIVLIKMAPKPKGNNTHGLTISDL